MAAAALELFSDCLPLAMLAQPRAWTGVGASKLCENHVRVVSPNAESAPLSAIHAV